MAQKTATRRLIRQPNGKLAVVFIDTVTGRTITNLQGYRIIGQGEKDPFSEEEKENKGDEEKEEDKEEEEELFPDVGHGDYRDSFKKEPGVKNNLKMNLTPDQKANLGKFIGGVAGSYFGGPIAGIIGAKVAERIVPKLLEEVETVKKEEEANPTKTESLAPINEDVVIGNPTTVKSNSNITEDIATADERNITEAAIEENPDVKTDAENAIDSVTSNPNGEDLEDRVRDIAGVDYNMGRNRPNAPEGDIVAQVRDVVTDMLGPDYSVNVVSGQESVNPITGKRDQYGSNRHRTGMAADLDIIDKNGNRVTDKDMLKDVAQLAAARYGANIGYGPEYMGPGRMHIDTVPADQLTKGQAAQWGSVGKSWADDLSMAREFGVASPAYYDKMTQNAPSSLMSREEALRDPNEAIAEVAFDRYSPAERDLMARTLAGEIDLSKTDLSTDEGRKEAFGILSTMENRASKFGGIQEAITADQQYSTWNTPEAANTANANYEANKEVYDSLVSEMERNASLNTGYTSYYNPSIANPSWGAKMENALDIGPHRFGSLPEYASIGNFGNNFGQYDMTKGNIQNATTDFVDGTSGLMADATADVDLSGYSPDDRDSFDNGGFGGMTSAENANRDGFGDSNDTRDSGSFGDSFGDTHDSGDYSGSSGYSGSDSGDYSAHGGQDSPGEGRGSFGDSFGSSSHDSVGGTSSTSTGGTSSGSTGGDYSGHGGQDSPSERTGRFG